MIELPGSEHFPISKGSAVRHHDLATAGVATEGGSPLIDIFRRQSRPMPSTLDLKERHPSASQAFYPLQDRKRLAVVSSGEDPCDLAGMKAFAATEPPGVNYARSIWNHPLLALQPDSDFLVVDRSCPDNDLDEHEFTNSIRLSLWADRNCVPRIRGGAAIMPTSGQAGVCGHPSASGCR